MKFWNSHKMNVLQPKRDVTHLNSVHAFWHEFRPICVDPPSRFDPPPDSRPLGRTLRCGKPGPAFRLSAVSYLHGLCPTYVERRIARHRHVFPGPTSAEPKRESSCIYPDRFARPDSHLHLHLRRSCARRALARRSHFRPRSFLCDGSRVHGFQTPQLDRAGRRLLCHPNQGQLALLPAAFPAVGSCRRGEQRPNRQVDSDQGPEGIPCALAQGALLRPRNPALSRLSDQSSRNPGSYRGPYLSFALAHRVVLSLGSKVTCASSITAARVPMR